MIRATPPQPSEAPSAISCGTSLPATTPLCSAERPAKATRKPKGSHSMQGGSGEANRLAVVILEVLAGVKTPSDAAVNLGISLPRYYQLETRALEGLVLALEPKPKGKQPSPQHQIAVLQQELEQTRRACARQQALARVAQRTLAVKLPSRPTRAGQKGAKPPGSQAAVGKAPEPRDRAGRRRRRPAVRAIKAVQALRKNVRPAEAEAVQPSAPAEAGAPPTPPREAAPLGV